MNWIKTDKFCNVRNLSLTEGHVPLVSGRILIVKLYLVKDAELIYNMAFNYLSICIYVDWNVIYIGTESLWHTHVHNPW